MSYAVYSFVAFPWNLVVISPGKAGKWLGFPTGAEGDGPRESPGSGLHRGRSGGILYPASTVSYTHLSGRG